MCVRVCVCVCVCVCLCEPIVCLYVCIYTYHREKLEISILPFQTHLAVATNACIGSDWTIGSHRNRHVFTWRVSKALVSDLPWKQDAAHEPECKHVEHFCETSYLNSLPFPLLPYQCTVDCGMQKRVECKVWTAECKVWSVECKVLSAGCKV